MLIPPETRIQLYNNFNMLCLVVLNLRPCRIVHIIYLHMSCPICAALHGVASWKTAVHLLFPFQLILYSFCAHSHVALERSTWKYFMRFELQLQLQGHI
jgi:hypothetical protein